MSETGKYTAGGYLPASFLDWDGRVTAVVFSTGCNFRCPWCHNGALVRREVEPVPADEIIADIARRANFLDGVCISGGEPTLWDGLAPFIRAVRNLNLPVKLDTNGSNPGILQRLLTDGLISHVAMDIKAPLDSASYARVAHSSVPIERIKESVEIIRNTATSYEFRTTFVPQLMTPGDLLAIRKYLNADPRWFAQCFKPVGCLDEEYLTKEPASEEELKGLLHGVAIRG